MVRITRSSRTPQPDEKNAIAKYLERSPAATLAGAVVAVSSVIYGLTSYVYSQKIEGLKLEYENKASKIDREYQANLRLLEEERSRITFTAKSETSFLNLSSLFVREESLLDDYKRFRFAGFAVPSNVAGSRWFWRESNELELLKEAGRMDVLDAISFDEASLNAVKSAFQQSASLQSFESPNEVDVIMDRRPTKLRSRCIFQSFSKKTMDTLNTVFNHVNNVADRFELEAKIAQWLADDLLPLDAAWNSDSTTGKVISAVDPDMVGSALAHLESTRSEMILQAMQIKIGEDKYTRIRESFTRHKSVTSATTLSDTAVDMSPASKSMDVYYRQIFVSQFQSFNNFDDVVIDEISLNNSYFVIKGRWELKTPSNKEVRLYFLRIGIRADDRIFAIGYSVPVGDDLEDVRTAMSMVSGFKVLK